jgi:HEAT repeat protein
VDRFLALANAGDNSELADTAKMALGVIARNLASTDQARSDALMNSFITQLRSSTDARSQWKLLLILGNAGTPATYDAVNDYLASPDSKLRSTAINALRWQKDPRVPGQLLRALNEDEDERVRIAAAKTMAFRPKTAGEYAAFKSALSNDKSANMRTVVLDILWQNRAIYPEAAKLVRHAAEHDIDQSVRERAKKLLKTTSTRK